jgi:nitrite reductase/ring-hydroxylating ferredoxin subunit
LAWHEVPGAQALGEDEAMGLVVDERPIALCRSGGTLYALHDVCTHQFALLSEGYVEDGCIECPLHQGRFDLGTGAPKAPPVTEPVRVYRVKTEDGKVYVDLGDDDGK